MTSSYLKNLPQVYTIGIERKLYTRFRFWLYFIDGIWQSLVVFYAFYFLYGSNPNANGEPESNLQLSTSVAVTAIVLANLVPGFNTLYWTWLQFLFIGIELLIAFLPRYTITFVYQWWYPNVMAKGRQIELHEKKMKKKKDKETAGQRGCFQFC